MKALLNRILDREQIASILDNLLANRPVKILRVIARTGKHASSVPWVYYSNELTGEEARVILKATRTSAKRYALVRRKTQEPVSLAIALLHLFPLMR